jgi:hypothetical protein
VVDQHRTPSEWENIRPFNHIEWTVFTFTDQAAAADSEFCGCTKCKADAAAITLVGLEPIYSTSDDGWNMAQSAVDHPSVQARIRAKVEEAVRMVKARPRH